MKILGSDYDGTLTHGLGSHTYDAIRKWRVAGNRFGIVSGRGVDFRDTLLREHPELELDFFIGFNGGAIVNGEGQLIYEKRYYDVPSMELISDLFEWECPFIHYNGDAYYCVIAHDSDKPSWVLPNDFRKPHELTELPYFVQISTQLPSVAEAAVVVERIRSAYGHRLNPLQNGTCIDIVPPSINKTTGLLQVASHFGVGRENVIAVGDNINDTDMIRDFYSYAMASGVESIKTLADEITESVIALIERELS